MHFTAGPFLLNKKYAFQLLIEHFFEAECELSAFLPYFAAYVFHKMCYTSKSE